MVKSVVVIFLWRNCTPGSGLYCCRWSITWRISLQSHWGGGDVGCDDVDGDGGTIGGSDDGDCGGAVGAADQ